MLIDSSALTSMLTDEGEARRLAVRMQASSARMTSPMIVAQTSIDVAGLLGLPVVEAAEAVRIFLQLMNIQVLAVPPRAAALAMEAYDRFGAGKHAASLDLADCVTYACARYYRQPLLCTAEHFARTDLDMA